MPQKVVDVVDHKQTAVDEVALLWDLYENQHRAWSQISICVVVIVTHSGLGVLCVRQNRIGRHFTLVLCLVLQPAAEVIRHGTMPSTQRIKSENPTSKPISPSAT
jgi:hypothetical protein